MSIPLKRKRSLKALLRKPFLEKAIRELQDTSCLKWAATLADILYESCMLVTGGDGTGVSGPWPLGMCSIVWLTVRGRGSVIPRPRWGEGAWSDPPLR